MSFSIKSKLVLNVCWASLVVILLVGIGYFQMNSLAAIQEKGYGHAEESMVLQQASHVGAIIYQVIAADIIDRDPAKALKEWQEAKGNSLKLMEEAAKIADQPDEKPLCDNATKAMTEVIAIYENKLQPLLKSNSGFTPEIRELDAQIDAKVETIRENMMKLSDIIAGEVKTDGKEYVALQHETNVLSVAMGVIGILLIVIVSVWIMGGITRPLNATIEFLGKVADGDFSARMESRARDEMAHLAGSVNAMLDNINKVLLTVVSTTDQVSSAATQLQATAGQMASDSEKVAAQAGTVAVAGEEMASTSIEIAHNCNIATDGAKQANASALTGAAVVEGTVSMMNRIAERVRCTAQTVESLGERSDQIGAIIGTIEDIADQTNLLALNAAIEAARAGDQGRGFAVVADEVRALAERTSRATREIGEMIKSIQQETKSAVGAMEAGVHEVENGTSEAARSGEALKEILEEINAVSMQVNQISTAAEEQTATTGEISNNMQQITEVVLETANGAQQSAGAASRLASLADDLQKLVGRFKLSETASV